MDAAAAAAAELIARKSRRSNVMDPPAIFLEA
jgi:hypothetical protein